MHEPSKPRLMTRRRFVLGPYSYLRDVPGDERSIQRDRTCAWSWSPSRANTYLPNFPKTAVFPGRSPRALRFSSRRGRYGFSRITEKARELLSERKFNRPVKGALRLRLESETIVVVSVDYVSTGGVQESNPTMAQR